MSVRIYNEPILFIDFSYYILHRYFAIQSWCKLAKKTLSDDEMISRFEDKFEENFLKISKKYCVKPDNILLIGDECRKNIWRKDIYSEYKSSRDDMPLNIPSKFFDVVYTHIIPNVTTKFKTQFITFERLEADDIISILTRYSLDNNLKNIVIITNDNDYQQLNDEHVKIYNLKEVDICKRGTCNPIKDLRLKILLGDKSDNIKSICTKRIANLIVDMNENEFRDYLESNNMLQDYDFNATLIDFGRIPKKFVDEVEQCISVLERN